MHRRVARVQDPVQFATSPAQRVVGPCVESNRDGMDVTHRHPVGEAAFETRYRGLADPSPTGHSGLRHAGPEPKHADCRGEPKGIHAHTISHGAHRAITRRILPADSRASGSSADPMSTPL
jgi:hypothetical protein